MAQRERSIRLTNHLRDCFIRAVSDDIPKPKAPDYDEVQKLLRENFPETVKAVYDDPDTRKLLESSWVYLGGGQGRYFWCCGQNYSELPVMVAYQEAFEKRSEAIQALRGVAYGVTTLKALREALPELTKYMADEAKAPTPGLPVPANLYATLKAVGLKS